MVSGSLLVCSCWPLVSGSSIGTPTVSSGAVTMKTISSTSITSTNGVTLISCIGLCLRARLRRPPPGRCGVGMLAAMGSIPLGSGAYVDLTRHDGRELVGEGFEPLAQARAVGRKLVVE